MPQDEGVSEIKERGRKQTIFLLFFLVLIGIILLGQAYSLAREKLPKCRWERKNNPIYSSGEKVENNQSALKVLKGWKNFSSAADLKVKSFVNFWEIRVLRNGKVKRKYGISKLGRIYSYERFCYKPEKKKSFFEKIKRMPGILRNLTS